LGLSAGSTPEGGNCVIAIAEKSGQTYLAVVMNANSTQTENFAYSDAKTLLNTCFNNFSVQKVAKSGDIHHEIPVSLAANVDHVILHAAKDISALLPNNVDIEKDILLKKLVYSDAVAPISANQIFGELEVVYKGTITLGKTELAAGNSVDRSNLLYFLDALRRFFTSPWFITAFITAIILFAIYCFLYYKALKNKRGYRRYK
jgi:D-alanyl-D-alanine carboxypeptidase (penicillin-binding protein 5/6)